MVRLRHIQPDQLDAFCRRWRIQRLSLFGSTLRDEDGPGSDIDLLVEFDPDANWSLWDHIRMEQELASFVGKPVDLVSRSAVEQAANPYRRRSILESAEPIYVA